METIFYMLVGIVFGLTSVFFYVLGLSHGRKIEKGLQVKIEPIKAISDQIESIKTGKEEKEKSKEFSDNINKVLTYNGRKRADE